MRNVKNENGTWIFKIQGRDSLSSLIQIALILGPAGGTGAIIWLICFIEPTMPWGDSEGPMIVIILASLILAIIAMLVGTMVMGMLVASGLGARYQVRISGNTNQVSAFDRRKGKTLWKSTFDPGKLYIAQTRIHSRYLSYLQPALVYGDSRQDLVEYDVPTQHKTMLTTAPQQDLERLMKALGAIPFR